MSYLNTIFGSQESEEKRKEHMKGKEMERGNIHRKLFYYFILVNSKLWINYGI